MAVDDSPEMVSWTGWIMPLVVCTAAPPGLPLGAGLVPLGAFFPCCARQPTTPTLKDIPRGQRDDLVPALFRARSYNLMRYAVGASRAFNGMPAVCLSDCPHSLVIGRIPENPIRRVRTTLAGYAAHLLDFQIGHGSNLFARLILCFMPHLHSLPFPRL